MASYLGSSIASHPITDDEILQVGSWKEAWDEAFDEASMVPPTTAGFGAQRLPSRTASLQMGSCTYEREEDLDEELEDLPPTGWQAYKQEFWRLLRLAVPLSVSGLCAFALSLVTISFVGRLGEYELSVVILSTSVFNTTGLSVLTGFAAAMETFCGQAFGAGRYTLVGVVLQRAVLMTCVLVAAIGGLWSQAEPLLILMGQDQEISKGAGRFLRLALPALMCCGLYEEMKRYLMAQGVVRPPSLATILALVLSPVYNYLYIVKFRWGLDGAALVLVSVQVTMAGSLALYIVVREWRKRGTETCTWGGWSMEAFRGWGSYLKFAGPSVIMLCCEWWTFEAVIILSGLLPNPQLNVASTGVVIYTSSIVYMTVSGVAGATSVRVSNSLGAGYPKAARVAMLMGLVQILILEACIVTGIMLGHNVLPYIYTNVPSVAEETSRLLPILATGLTSDGINACMQGLLRGAGKQGVGAITNLASYWIFGIPLAAFLAFKMHWGAHGLWWGLVTTNIMQGTIMLVIGLTLNFEKLAERAATLFQQRHPLAQPLLDGSTAERGSVKGEEGAPTQNGSLAS